MDNALPPHSVVSFLATKTRGISQTICAKIITHLTRVKPHISSSECDRMLAGFCKSRNQFFRTCAENRGSFRHIFPSIQPLDWPQISLDDRGGCLDSNATIPSKIRWDLAIDRSGLSVTIFCQNSCSGWQSFASSSNDNFQSDDQIVLKFYRHIEDICSFLQRY